MNSEIGQKLQYFLDLQNEIKALGEKAHKDETALREQFESEQKELKTKYENLINDATKEAREKATKYKAELKEWFGVTDGERNDVVSFVSALFNLFKK